jgi:hypothetical protein
MNATTPTPSVVYHPISGNLEDEIFQALGLPRPTQKAVYEALNCSSHCILGGLHLGDAQALFDTSYRGSNPEGFQAVITVCPAADLLAECPFFDIEAAARTYAAQGIDWFHVGKMIVDCNEFWPALVHDCTLLDSEEARVVLTEKNARAELNQLNRKKRDAINQLHVSEWFVPIFRELDRAIFGDKKVLVHCRAGISRSATVIAAYLIARFRLSAVQAIHFLSTRRACINPQFLGGLSEYELRFTASGINTIYRK